MSDAGRLASRPPGRSSIDPITNITLLSPIRLERDTGALLSGGLPRHALPAYLHEATHHLCFFSPVGLALTLLNLRARRRALLLDRQGPPDFGDEDALDTIDVLDDYLRYDVLMRAQGPLAEGLATFAEFDALPGSSSVATDLMLVLGTFLGPPEDEGADVWKILGGTLLHARSGFEYGARKSGLLMQAMALDHGGYLAGYLMVKGLWRDAAAINARLTDSDLFLNLLATYVYSDFGLVAHLLDPDTSDYGAAGPIVNYFWGRLQALQGSLSDDLLDALEATPGPLLDESIEGNLEQRFEGIPNLGTDPELWAAGQERLVAMYDELEAEAQASAGPLGGLPRRQQWLLGERQLLCVGRLEVEVDISDAGWVRTWLHGSLLSGAPAIEGVPARERGPGSLEIFLNPWRWGRYMAYAVSAGGSPVVLWFSRDVAPVLRQQFLNYQTDTATVGEQERLLGEQLERQLQNDGTAAIVLPAVRENLGLWAERVYVSAALPHVAEAEVGALVERMAEDGLLAILGSQPLVRALAWLSLNWMLYDTEELEAEFRRAAVFHEAGDDVWATVTEIATLADRALGEPLVSVHDGRVVCSV